MTILAALEEVLTLNPIGIVTQYYADLNEANIDADYLANAQFPLQIILPIVPVDSVGTSGLLKTTFELHFFLLTKDEQQTTIQYKSRDLEEAVIAPMRLMARKYIHKLNEHSIIDPETRGITSVRYIPTYSAMDANVHGVEVIAQVPVIENPVLC